MTTSVQRLIIVLALASFATPALAEAVRRPPNNALATNGPANNASANSGSVNGGAGASSYRSHPGQLSSEELSASAAAGPTPEAPAAQRLAVARKAIDQVLGTLPAAHKPD